MFKLKSNSENANACRASTSKRANDNIYAPPKKKARVVLQAPATSTRAEAAQFNLVDTLLDAGFNYICEKSVEEAEEEEGGLTAQEAVVFNQFINAMPQLLSFILEGEANPTVETSCPCGGGLYHYTCRKCLQFDNCCKECFIDRHLTNLS
ncbi:hypothetical protein PQX77_021336 [Marasmius sp. AFHP31]|nr:hypothetical protein PQX77_021336 [Marasmius sp. AFHP31]